MWTGCGITPLHRAAEGGHVSVCNLIIPHLKDKNPKDYDGRTPLYLAAQNGHLEVCRLIIDNIEDPALKNPHNNYGRTPLDAAASRDIYFHRKSKLFRHLNLK